MRALSMTFGALLTSITIFIILEVAEPSMIVDHEVTSVQLEVRTLREAVIHYRASFGELPVSLDQLLSSGVIERLPKDRWGNRYIYRRTEAQHGFVVYSSGIDAIDQNGKGDDVITDEKNYGCSNYGINCPLTPFEWGKLLSVLFFVLSIVGLAVLTVIRITRWRKARKATVLHRKAG